MTKAIDVGIARISQLTAIEAVLWLFSVVVVTSWTDPLQGAQIGTILLALFCLRTFLGNGGRTITPLGVFALVTLFTAAFPAYEAWDDTRVSAEALRTTVGLTYLLTFLVTMISWRLGREIRFDKKVLPGRWLFIFIGLVLYAFSYQFRASELLPGIIIETPAIVGILLVAFGAWWSRSVILLVLSLPVVLGMSAVYVLDIHSGQGRLRIAAVGLGLLVLFAIRVRGFWIKLLAILMGPGALMVFATLRKAHQESINKGNSANRTGLESLTDPFVTFANLVDLHEQGRFEFQGGKNLLTPLTPIAPESWDLPRAVGYELVKYWKPEKAIPKYDWYSVAANATGEWYWMWGSIGVVIGGLALGLGIALFNWSVTRGHAALQTRWWAPALFITAVTFAAGLGDLVWGGLHIYWFRTLPRIGLEIAIAFFVAFVVGIVSLFRGDKTKSTESGAEGNLASEAVQKPSPIGQTADGPALELDEQPQPEPAADPEPVMVTDTAEPVVPEPEPAVAVVKQSAPDNKDDNKKLRVAAAAFAAAGAVGAVGWLVGNRSKTEVDARAEKLLREMFNEK
ncbi:procyclic acidic repetitive family protein [Corynebacterium amycolatum]|uniref:procyclic acidic repetitive family protein n=1 Tax=Corynebacterium amycolatum TaxID=43765 RepID=UPI00234E03D2|nr:procyclic acidic repetitive family protein [Corynebacterium amycolatum]MDC7116343.1 procyclic acidic repetitive family protein [Corynebacterium amycolatum]